MINVTETDLLANADLTAAGEAFDLLRQATELGEAQASPDALDDCLARAAAAAEMAWPGSAQEGYSFAVLAASIRRRAALWGLVGDVTEPAPVVLMVDEVDEVTRLIPELAAVVAGLAATPEP